MPQKAQYIGKNGLQHFGLVFYRSYTKGANMDENRRFFNVIFKEMQREPAKPFLTEAKDFIQAFMPEVCAKYPKARTITYGSSIYVCLLPEAEQLLTKSLEMRIRDYEKQLLYAKKALAEVNTRKGG